MSLRVFAYAACSTCRNALKFLAERGVACEVIPIREQPPSVADLRAMLPHVGGEVRRLFNTSGLDYRAMKLSGRLPAMSLDEALALLASHGNLVKRPFALSGKAGVVGFKPAAWERFVNPGKR